MPRNVSKKLVLSSRVGMELRDVLGGKGSRSKDWFPSWESVHSSFYVPHPGLLNGAGTPPKTGGGPFTPRLGPR